MANEDQDLELDIEEATEGGGKSKLIIIAAAVFLIGGGAAAFFLIDSGSDDTAQEVQENTEEGAEVAKGPATYVGVPEAITSNIPGKNRNRTVQIKMSFMVRSSDAEDAVKMHMPQLKNDVLMLVSQQSADELKTPQGREKLQQQALETVQSTLTNLVGEPTVEKVLFISFVMQ